MQLNLEMPLLKMCQDGSAQKTTHLDVSWEGLSAQMMPYLRRQDSSGPIQAWSLDQKDAPRGVSSMLNISDWPNGASVSSLSQILETGPIHVRFYLSELTCRGILRRAEKRGKTLPSSLQAALEATASPELAGLCAQPAATTGGGSENLVATFDRQSNAEYGSADLASTVSARDYKSPTDLVAHCLAGNMLNRAAENGPMGSGISEDVSFTLTKNDVHAVCITGEITHALKAEGADASEDGTGRGNPIVAFGWQNSASQGLSDSEHISPTLDKSKTPAVAMTVALRGREGGATAELGGEVATALRASGGGGDKAHVMVNYAADIAPTLSKESYSPTKSASGQQADWGVVTQSAVRRLTPVECERLQGFPDDYTNIPWRGKPTSPDGPRYKALGNSWAVPKFTWIGERIARFMPGNDNEAINEAA